MDAKLTCRLHEEARNVAWWKRERRVIHLPDEPSHTMTEAEYANQLTRLRQARDARLAAEDAYLDVLASVLASGVSYRDVGYAIGLHRHSVQYFAGCNRLPPRFEHLPTPPVEPKPEEVAPGF